MVSFNQRDQRWVSNLLAPSTLTIGRYGCTTTCIADLSTYFGDNLTPDVVAKTVKYTTDGLIIWTSCVFPHFKFEHREYGRQDKNIQSALDDPNRAVILNVAHGSHWVVCVKKSLFGSYRIADPWLGDFTTMTRYKNDISGAAYFQRG